MSGSKTIGVIGLGSIGMRHAKNLIAMGHGVMGFDPAGIPSGYGLYHALNMDHLIARCDGVVISSPTRQHHQHLMRITDASKPVFVEKPIADGIFDIPEWVGEVGMVGNNLRFHSCVKKAKEWLSEGLIGKPLWASFCVAQHNTKYTDPVVLNWGAHEFDLALYLLGPATVTAAAGNDKIFDTCLLHEYGVPSTIHCDYVTKPERRAFIVAGTVGLMSINLAAGNAILFKSDGSMGATFGIANPTSPFDQSYIDEMQAFIDLIDGKPVPHAATGQDGLNALELILEAQKMASK